MFRFTERQLLYKLRISSPAVYTLSYPTRFYSSSAAAPAKNMNTTQHPTTQPYMPKHTLRAPIDTQIYEDHAEIRHLFKRFSESFDTVERRAVLNSFIRAVAVHSVAEEINVYPKFEKKLDHGKNIADHSRQEHQQIKDLLNEVDDMRVDDPKLAPTLAKLMDAFERHAREEEDTLLPALRKLITDEEAVRLGEEFVSTKKMAPTHPHPASSDKGGILQSMTGFMAMPFDKLRDATRTFAQ